MIGDTLAAVKRLRSPGSRTKPLVRADLRVLRLSYRGRSAARRCRRVGHRAPGPQSQSRHRRDARGWLDRDRLPPARSTTTPPGAWISRAEVDEIAFTAFSSRKATEQAAGQLVVRRIPDLNQPSDNGQAALFDVWRLHFFITTDLDTVAADKIHRGHAIIEQVHADLEDSALAHLPSGRFTANAAWLVLAAARRSPPTEPHPAEQEFLSSP